MSRHCRTNGRTKILQSALIGALCWENSFQEFIEDYKCPENAAMIEASKRKITDYTEMYKELSL